MPKKITHEEFIEKLKLIKPNIEVISQYDGNKKYITVRCTIHNHTWQSKPNWLMHEGKYDCQKCYDERRGETTRIGKEAFVEKANIIYGNKFDYSKTDYVNNKTKIIIICPQHGEFLTVPQTHINGSDGCPKCANRNVTTEEFIEKARKIHGDKYDYSKVIYKTNRDKVIIICSIHGEFQQAPDKHLGGHNCPVCNESKLEILCKKFLTTNNINFIQQKTFNWLGRQSLDFYLPEYNIGVECQGGQHFKSIKHFGGENGFIKILKRDITKNQLCGDNGINLIYSVDENEFDQEIFYNKKFSNIYNDNNTIIVNMNNNGRELKHKLNIL